MKLEYQIKIEILENRQSIGIEVGGTDMYALTKFFEKKAYQEDFVAGNWYLSSLSAFTKTYPERGLKEAAKQGNKLAEDILKKQHNNSQRDVLEGTIASVTPDQIPELSKDFRNVMCTDIMIRAKGYDYCNLMCFCKMEYHQRLTNSGLTFDLTIPDMHNFGDYAVIITDPDELIRRIDMAIKNTDYQYVCGTVNYHSLTFNEENAEKKNTMTLAMHDPIDIENILKRSRRIDYDAFDKCDVYKEQNEWRIAVNTKLISEEPIRLSVGDLSDIVVSVKRNDLPTKMRKLITKFKIRSVRDGYYGNIDRLQMRDEFYRLGNNKGFLVSTIG